MAKVLAKKGRKAPDVTTLKRLFALSGNQCARPTCGTVLLTSDGKLIGEVAHIAAENKGGARWDATLSEEQRRAFENLLLLCPNCHTLVDKKPVKVSAAALRKWKRDREARFEAVGELLQKSYLAEITDDAETTGSTLPVNLGSYVTFKRKRDGQEPFLDEDTPAAIAGYVESLRHIVVGDRQLMMGVVEKALALGGRREDEHGVKVHIDDLKTIRVNHVKLSDYRIDKLARTLDRHGLGSIDGESPDYELFIRSVGTDLGWSDLAAYAESRKTTLASLLVDLKFGILD